MTVWVATVGWDYEGEQLFGVFESKEAAIEAFLADVWNMHSDPEGELLSGDTFSVVPLEPGDVCLHDRPGARPDALYFETYQGRSKLKELLPKP